MLIRTEYKILLYILFFFFGVVYLFSMVHRMFFGISIEQLFGFIQFTGFCWFISHFQMVSDEQEPIAKTEEHKKKKYRRKKGR